jgi:hypothetical protein
MLTASYRMVKVQVRTLAFGSHALKQAPKNATEDRLCLRWRFLLSCRRSEMRRTGPGMFWLSRRLACVTMIVVPWFVIASRSHAKCGVDSRARAPPLCPGGMGSLVHPLPSREWNLPFAIPFHQLYADRQPQQPSGATLYALHIHRSSHSYLYSSLQDSPHCVT